VRRRRPSFKDTRSITSKSYNSFKLYHTA
jgi:hypothetical protein